jgi:hypothetical protein
MKQRRSTRTGILLIHTRRQQRPRGAHATLPETITMGIANLWLWFVLAVAVVIVGAYVFLRKPPE